jgi:small-conductance mechanosensitive channel
VRRLVDWLHAAGLADERLPIALRIAAVLAASLAIAWVSGAVYARWLRRGAGESEPVDELARSFRRTVLLVGVYEAVRQAPLPPLVGAALAGVLFVLAALLAARVAVRSLRLLLHSYLDRTAEGAARERARRDYLPVASTTGTVLVALLAVIVVAHHFGHDVSSLVAAFGVGSLALGLAAQQTLGNMVAGFTLLIDRPFSPGDQVRLQSGEQGEVLEIGVRSTRILLPDGKLLIVPNAELAGSRVVNQSYPAPTARSEVRLRVGWSADVDRMTELLLELAHAQPETLTQPPPSVALAALDGKGLDLAMRFAVEGSEAKEPVEERVRRALVKRLTSEGAEMGAPPAAVPSAPVEEQPFAPTTRSRP